MIFWILDSIKQATLIGMNTYDYIEQNKCVNFETDLRTTFEFGKFLVTSNFGSAIFC